jgi:cyclic-di-GMP phosphodiesterase TipF (flagellum assembly factor)
MRLAALFVAICMLIIAGCAGAIAHFYVGAGMTGAATVAVVTLTALAIYNASSTRTDATAALSRQLADLARAESDLARQVAEIGRRLASVEARVEARGEARAEAIAGRTPAAVEPLMEEIGELGNLVKQLAETIANQQISIELLERQQPPPVTDYLPAEPVPAAQPPQPTRSAPPVALAQQMPLAQPAPVVQPAPPPAPAIPFAPTMPSAPAAAPAVGAPVVTLAPVPTTAAAPAAPAAPPPAVETRAVADRSAAPPEAAIAEAIDEGAQAAAIATIQTAIEANRIDLCLQPIVTLPQRKVRYYEALSRLRDERGQMLAAADFVPRAERGGLMPRIDNLVIFRCVQVVRRLLLKNRDVGLFCNLSGATLVDSVAFPQVLEFLDANRAIAPSLVLEFPQQAVRAMGPIEHESLAALSERGYRFSMDNITDLRLEPRELAGHGFRFIKVRANLLLNRAGGAPSHIHPADLPDLVGRFGIDLIAERIESEGSVVDLLDCDVRFGQGFLFSPPRPVRAEALQGTVERVEAAPGAAAGAAAEQPLRARFPRAAAGEVGRGASAFAQLARGAVARG